MERLIKQDPAIAFALEMFGYCDELNISFLEFGVSSTYTYPTKRPSSVSMKSR